MTRTKKPAPRRKLAVRSWLARMQIGEALCPWCASHQIAVERQLDPHRDQWNLSVYIVREMRCQACRATWEEEYRLVAYSCLEPP
jgi:hypothetical protein